jgi:hypothetical protein
MGQITLMGFKAALNHFIKNMYFIEDDSIYSHLFSPPTPELQVRMRFWENEARMMSLARLSMQFESLCFKKHG